MYFQCITVSVESMVEFNLYMAIETDQGIRRLYKMSEDAYSYVLISKIVVDFF